MNKENFDNTVKQYYQLIYRYCLARLSEPMAAQDCTQEVFLTFYKKLSVLEDDNILGWLYRTASNLVNNYRKNAPCLNSLEETDADEIAVNDNYSEERPFEDILTETELKMLSEHYIDGYDIAEVAQRNNKSVAAVYKSFQRLKVKLGKRKVGADDE